MSECRLTQFALIWPLLGMIGAGCSDVPTAVVEVQLRNRDSREPSAGASLDLTQPYVLRFRHHEARAITDRGGDALLRVDVVERLQVRAMIEGREYRAIVPAPITEQFGEWQALERYPEFEQGDFELRARLAR